MSESPDTGVMTFKGKMRARLQPGEVVVLAMRPSKTVTCGLYVITIGLWEIWRRRHQYIVTDQHAILVKGIVSRSERSLPLDRVQDATTSRQLWVGAVVVSTAGGQGSALKMTGLSSKQSRRLSSEILAAVKNQSGYNPASQSSLAPQSSVADELAKLAGLRDSGALSEDEFAAQKAKLLGS